MNTLNTPRSIVVIGANGGIGKHVVKIALDKGLRVTAVVRNPSKLTLTHPNLEIIQGDILKERSLAPILEGKDAVVSTLGSGSLKTTEVYSRGATNIIAAMQDAKVKRAFFVSASGLEVNRTHSLIVRLVTKYVLQRILKNMYADLVRMEQIVKSSSIDWTIVRPPRLTDQSATGDYRVAINKVMDNPMTISRANVAHFIINNLMESRIEKAMVEIAD